MQEAWHSYSIPLLNLLKGVEERLQFLGMAVSFSWSKDLVQTISIIIGLIGIKCTDFHGSQMMYAEGFGGPMTFPLPPRSQHFLVLREMSPQRLFGFMVPRGWVPVTFHLATPCRGAHSRPSHWQTIPPCMEIWWSVYLIWHRLFMLDALPDATFLIYLGLGPGN